jgi:hypothetical protein
VVTGEWVQVILPLTNLPFETGQRLILINDVAKGGSAEVSFRRFGIFKYADAQEFGGAQQTLIDNPEQGDAMFCSVSGECKTISKRKIRCVVRATLRSVDGAFFAENAQMSVAFAGNKWVPVGSGKTSLANGLLERRFNATMTLGKNGLFALADFSNVGCKVSSQIQ